MPMVNSLQPSSLDSASPLGPPVAPTHHFSDTEEQHLVTEDRSAGRSVALEMAAVFIAAVLMGAAAVLWIVMSAN
ncbi:MAG: hypothetical protein K8T25_13470 [Planctomycetia bacterium]|nr:hypothetical protein [Planctomycetia bacterium]